MNIDNLRLQTLTEDQYNLLLIIRKEYELGMLALNSLGPNTFTFYGGHAVKQDDPAYKMVHRLAKKLAKLGWGVVSGGGPGMMSAALDGAKEGDGQAIAFCIEIEDEKTTHKYPDVSLTFSQFSVRKYMLRQSDAFAFAPGGFGTLDELMEILTLIKTNKFPKKPVFLLDSSFWKGYLTWFEEILSNERKVISEDFMNMFILVDDEDEVIKHLYNKN
jgi:uncharacterized protein (TIGR00730 family)